MLTVIKTIISTYLIVNYHVKYSDLFDITISATILYHRRLCNSKIYCVFRLFMYKDSSKTLINVV